MKSENWILKVLILILLLCILGVALYPMKSGNLVRLTKNVSSAVVWIGAEYGSNDYEYYGYDETYKGKIKWQGTGFLISSDGLIATAGHVVEDTGTFQLVFSDGRKGRAKFVYMESSDTCDAGFIQVTWIQQDRIRFREWVNPKFLIDLLWLKEIPDLPIEGFSYLNFDTKVNLAENLIIVGYPWGLQKGLTVTQGIVSAVDRNIPFFGSKFMIHTDTASWPGNSGSPVIDMDGEVVGILVGGMRSADNYSLITPAKIVQLTLNKYLADEALRKAK